MDPLTITAAVGIATKAFETIKAGFQIGRDLESMTGDIGRWMGAVSDVDNAEKQAKNPPLFKNFPLLRSIFDKLNFISHLGKDYYIESKKSILSID